MAGKRTSTTRPRAEPSRRGRPRRAVRSTYATVEGEGYEGEQPENEQPETRQEPPPAADPAQPTAAQELQQLQTQLQNLQQERDRIAAAYAASQEAAPTIQPAVPNSAGPTLDVQPANYGGMLRGTSDLRSPLSEGLQTSPWPTTYKPITLPKFSGKADPRQFLMSFKAAVASAGGNETVMAKSFVIAAEGDALAWYSMLRPGSIYSWENLRDKILANFQGFAVESLTSTDLFQCRQSQGEALREYFQRFVQTKARAPGVPEEVAIEAAIKGLRIGPFAAHLAREKPASMHGLYHEFEKYCRSDNDYRKRYSKTNYRNNHQ
ncbi:uncharacterized protein LOC110432454 [Sorghum bicolor]|uniref:uncharacterized protein LOC110432454 n=1 Tax=Sorghum bicolor TaxID=4558 RepID=UPI000B424FDA|nr:uncharacterized protein LOC110432454 [Sorghum bicolor]|eukprot:XP_021308584.1 uncharacterized protein LOC110432454 [Sorghum bicolor]